MASSTWLEMLQERLGLGTAPAPSRAAPSPPAQGSLAAVVGPSASTSLVPLVRLARVAAAHVRVHRGRYLTAVATVTALVGAVHMAKVVRVGLPLRRGLQPWRVTPDPRVEGDGGAEIEFVDPVESRFTAYLKGIHRTRREPFLLVLRELQGLVAERDALTAAASAADGGAEAAREGLEDLHRRIDFKARQADELLTQYVVSLDGLPVKGKPELRERRRVLIKEAVAMGDGVAPYLASHKSATADAQGPADSEADDAEVGVTGS